MKVYLVESHWGYGDRELEGIYSTMALAVEAHGRLTEAIGDDYSPVGIEIRGVELDAACKPAEAEAGDWGDRVDEFGYD